MYFLRMYKYIYMQFSTYIEKQANIPKAYTERQNTNLSPAWKKQKTPCHEKVLQIALYCWFVFSHFISYSLFKRLKILSQNHLEESAPGI